MDYAWRKTTLDIYLAIYEQHKDDLVVFESYTNMGTHGEKLEAQITAWGFRGAEHPIIRSELGLGEWIYSIIESAVSDE